MIAGRPRRHRIILAHHLVFTGYGHWLPNDIRGSGSDSVRQAPLKSLGDIHRGRKPAQPDRIELRHFHQAAEPLLQEERIWFDGQKRSAIAEALAKAATSFHYTVWACAILSNHAHLVVQRHAHRHDVMWRTLAEAARQAVQACADVPAHHRVWGERPYCVFLFSPAEIESRIQYVNENPEKEGLPPQQWEFVKPFRS